MIIEVRMHILAYYMMHDSVIETFAWRYPLRKV
jgi:hypothetical protein